MNPKNWIAACALAGIFFVAGFGICKFLYNKSSSGCDFSKELHIEYPKDFTGVCAKVPFEAALQQYAKLCDLQGPSSGPRMHAVWWGEDKLAVANSCCDNAKPNTGSHVTQWVAFANTQELEAFLAATRPQ
jgi:hypothetical protein